MLFLSILFYYSAILATTSINAWTLLACFTHFQIGTIIITLGLPIESHHRTSSSPLFRKFLLSYVWVAMYNQFCTHILSIHIIQYRLNVDLIREIDFSLPSRVLHGSGSGKIPRVRDPNFLQTTLCSLLIT